MRPEGGRRTPDRANQERKQQAGALFTLSGLKDRWAVAGNPSVGAPSSRFEGAPRKSLADRFNYLSRQRSARRSPTLRRRSRRRDRVERRFLLQQPQAIYGAGDVFHMPWPTGELSTAKP